MNERTNLIHCENLTKMSLEAQNQNLRLLAKVDAATKFNIMQAQKSIFHKLKSVHGAIDNAVVTLASLILAVDMVVGKLDSVNLNAVKLRGKSNKAKVKRQKLLGLWSIVRALKLEQNMSFRQISAYFAKYHKLVVSYSTIYELWNELEKNTTNQEN